MKTLTVLWVIFCLAACGSATSPGDPCNGKCQPSEVCTVDGRCLADCHPQCENRVCGNESTCNTSCGECELGDACTIEGICKAHCTPYCGSKKCGPDPACGASCGECSNGENCNDAGECVVIIDLPEQTYDFKIDFQDFASKLNPNFCTVDENNIIHDLIGFCNNTIGEVKPWVFDTEYTDLSTLPEIKEYAQNGKIKSVTLKKIRFEITSNTLNYNVTESLFYIGKPQVSSPGDSGGGIRVSKIPTLFIGTKIYGDLEITYASELKDLTNSMKFNYLGEGTKFDISDQVYFHIDGPSFDGMQLPSGLLTGTIYLDFQIISSPLN